MGQDYLRKVGIHDVETQAEFKSVANEWWAKEMEELAEIMSQRCPVPPIDATAAQIVVHNKAITFIETAKKNKIDQILRLAKIRDLGDKSRTPEQMRGDIIKEAQAALDKKAKRTEQDGDTD